MQGTVKWFNREQGFGFIVPTEGGADVFVHASAIEGDRAAGLNEGDRVEFEMTLGEKGPKATSVKPVE